MNKNRIGGDAESEASGRDITVAGSPDRSLKRVLRIGRLAVGTVRFEAPCARRMGRSFCNREAR
jgi:hypothetical protein